ncbi:TetR/AcrR family transcriptional regulator [Oceanibacterium hippocampi]|uniref:HTH-type transcriptional regulator RutR n=1 Tax=Oceanibacterium hippocampi TaxID=745714 RepID=A0A1Y5T803_9PROT|nr:TetR/AcrR family transcriptional regulator [Oceanibacterium hippocampi]SLN57473.1 HTH-type transcriptional regulator RutR [Oceanibacterium hippocampi]
MNECTAETTDNSPGRIRQLNEARIMQAAEQVFADAGFRGATTAAIAERAGLPKANVHYYFRTKSELYRAVLDNILKLWLDALHDITADDDPREALTHYIEAKVELSRSQPEASRVFANELIRGAPRLKRYLSNELRDWIDARVPVIQAWIAQGKIAPIDPYFLFFNIWAMTQTYADFQSQCAAVLGRGDKLKPEDYDRASAEIVTTVMRALGLETAPTGARHGGDD